jgi:hypothetical protein
MSETGKIKDPVHQTCDEQKGRRVGDRAIVYRNEFSPPHVTSFPGSTALLAYQRDNNKTCHGGNQCNVYGKHTPVEMRESFARGEDVALAPFMQDNYFVTGLIFTDSNFYESAVNSFLSKRQDSEPERPMLLSSVMFITNFEKDIASHPTRHSPSIGRLSQSIHTLFNTKNDQNRYQY